MNGNDKICRICGDEFNPRARVPGFQWADRCNDCNEYSDEGRDTIQAQTERMVRGEMARSMERMQAERRRKAQAERGEG